MISMRHLWTPIEGYAIIVRMSRLLYDGREPVLQAVVSGNLLALQKLFEKHLASPFDMRPDTNQSLIMVISLFILF